jgi:acyl carrier protein
MSIQNRIKEFVSKSMAVGSLEGGLAENESLLEKGILNSTSVLELVVFLEENFQISCADSEITPENLDSLASIASYVERKLARPQQSVTTEARVS